MTSPAHFRPIARGHARILGRFGAQSATVNFDRLARPVASG
jgi:hypothetical protein